MRASPLLSLLSIVVVGLGHVCRAIAKVVRIVPTRGRRPDLPSPLYYQALILSFTAPTGNSIGLAKIVVYMPICLFDLCKMAVPPSHTHVHTLPLPTPDVCLEIWPNNPRNVRISRHSLEQPQSQSIGLSPLSSLEP